MPKKKKEETEENQEAVEENVGEVKESTKEMKGIEEELSEEELEKVAEAESLETETKEISKKPKKKTNDESFALSEEEIEAKKKELLERAKKLTSKIDITKTEELKEQVRTKKKTETLLPLEEYVKAGIYLGTRFVTPEMRKYVYRRRADGLAILNTDTIDEKLKEGIEFLSRFNPKEVIVVCKRQAGWKVAQKFSELTGIRAFTKKYPAGILTNTTLPDFFENELTVVFDSWLDKNALHDTLKVHKKVLMIADTNNFIKGANQIIIGNNKSPKSLGIIFYLLTKGYCKAKGLDESQIPSLDWWTSGEEEN